MPTYQYRKSHCGDQTVVRSSYLHNGTSYTGKMASLYWFSPLVSIYEHLKLSVKWAAVVYSGTLAITMPRQQCRLIQRWSNIGTIIRCRAKVNLHAVWVVTYVVLGYQSCPKRRSWLLLSWYILRHALSMNHRTCRYIYRWLRTRLLISSALALKILQTCIKPSTYFLQNNLILQMAYNYVKDPQWFHNFLYSEKSYSQASHDFFYIQR